MMSTFGRYDTRLEEKVRSLSLSGMITGTALLIQTITPAGYYKTTEGTSSENAAKAGIEWIPITGGEFMIPALPIDNQFGPQDLYVYESGEWDLLGLPSGKIEWTYVGPWLP